MGEVDLRLRVASFLVTPASTPMRKPSGDVSRRAFLGGQSNGRITRFKRFGRICRISLGLSSVSYLTALGRSRECARIRPSRGTHTNRGTKPAMSNPAIPSQMRDLILASIQTQADLADRSALRKRLEQGSLFDSDLPGLRHGQYHPEEGYRRVRQTPREAVPVDILHLED